MKPYQVLEMNRKASAKKIPRNIVTAGKLGEKVRDFLRVRGRAALTASAIVALPLFLVGCAKFGQVMFGPPSEQRQAIAWQPFQGEHTPGTPHDKYPNVVWTENGKVRPAPGYCWAADHVRGKDFRVEHTPGTGTPHDKYPNVVWGADGLIYPAPGYCWAANHVRGKDFRVEHTPGTPHGRYPNVVWAENGEFRAADGYAFVSDDPPGKLDFRVRLEHILGTPHGRYPNVVWAENGTVRPAEGYCWVNRQNDPNDFRVQRIQINPNPISTDDFAHRLQRSLESQRRSELDNAASRQRLQHDQNTMKLLYPSLRR